MLFYRAFLLMLLLANPCGASYISLGATITSPQLVTEQSFIVNATVMNSGDEEAREVQLDILLPDGFFAQPAYLGALQPNVPYFAAFNVTVADYVKPGTYPLFVKNHYADSNAYPFSTLLQTLIRYRQPAPVRMRGSIRDLTLSSSGGEEKDLVIEVSNLDDRPHRLALKLQLPDELKAKFYSTELDLGARDYGSVSVPIRALGALPQSTYLVFASLEYEDGKLHFGSAASGVVKVVAEEGEVAGETTSYLPAAAIGVLLLVLVYHQIKK